MLAGMQRMSLIPGTSLEAFRPGVGPSYDDVVSGRDMVRYDKIPVKISEFHTEVFDMMDKEDRTRYEDLMKSIIKGIQTSECVIWKNDLQVISKGDGQHWMRYLEWARYDLNEPLLTRTKENSDEHGVSTPKGVLSEV